MNYIQLVSWTHGNASPWRCNRIWWVDTSFLCPMNGQLWDTFYMAPQKMSITTVPCLKWAATLTAWEQTLELAFLLCLLPQPHSFYMGSFFKMLASPGSRLHFLGGVISLETGLEQDRQEGNPDRNLLSWTWLVPSLSYLWNWEGISSSGCFPSFSKLLPFPWVTQVISPGHTLRERCVRYYTWVRKLQIFRWVPAPNLTCLLCSAVLAPWRHLIPLLGFLRHN